MEYRAKANIGVPGYGRVTPGEILDGKCKAILGEETLDDLVRRGALRTLRDAGTVPEPKESPEAKEPEEPAEAPGEEAEDEEAEALEPDTMDDVVDEDEAPEAEPAEKPKKNSRGRKAK